MTRKPRRVNMVAMSEMTVPEGSDSSEVYDRQHGKTTLADEQRLVNLSEGANKAPPQAQPFRVGK